MGAIEQLIQDIAMSPHQYFDNNSNEICVIKTQSVSLVFYPFNNVIVKTMP